jgi:hypothetical protein
MRVGRVTAGFALVTVSIASVLVWEARSPPRTPPQAPTASVSREAQVQIERCRVQLKARELSATAKQGCPVCPPCAACPEKATQRKVHGETTREGDSPSCGDSPEEEDETNLLKILRGLTEERDMLRTKLKLSATQVATPKHAPKRFPGAKEFDPNAGIELQRRLVVSTAEALLKASEVGKPTVFLAKGQHKGANQQLYGFIPEGAAQNPTLGYTDANLLVWGEENDVKDALKVLPLATLTLTPHTKPTSTQPRRRPYPDLGRFFFADSPSYPLGKPSHTS